MTDCDCLTIEECLSRHAPAVEVEDRAARRRRLNRERVARWKAAHPERWREIWTASEARRRARRLEVAA